MPSNNTWGHYQDNRVEWLLDEPARTHLRTYIDAGVVAFLFGGGAGGVTCACDGVNDGITNPAPINGNTGLSLSADDDGGFFRQKVKDYYAAGPLPLSGGSPPPPARRSDADQPTSCDCYADQHDPGLHHECLCQSKLGRPRRDRRPSPWPSPAAPRATCS